ncbi:MAG: PilT/PilU family type 4a pilus ATPase [Kofleriaceae bacterium]
MAAIDSLLRVMSLRGAEAMIISTGQVPTLRRAGQPEPMAMPPIDPLMVLGFVDELVAEERRAELDARGSGEVTHAVGADAYAISIERTSVGFRLLVRQAKPSAPKPTPTAAPVGRRAEPAAPPTAATPPSAGAAPSSSSSSSPATPADADLVAHAPPALLALLEHAAARGASDLFVSAGAPPRLRVDGELLELDAAAVDEAELVTLVAALGGPAARRALLDDGAVDFGATVGDLRVRGHGFQHERGVGVVLRLIRTAIPSMASLGLPDDLVTLVTQRSGLVLVAGPTGAGKSTTLVALLGYLNRVRARHVVSLEDPIEYLHSSGRCLIHQREIGRHAPSFAAGLRAALREAPDVIVVGELRDPATIAIALTAAETGHLVLGTVHAASAAGAVARLIDAYPAHQQDQARSQLAAALRTVVTQYLVPNLAGGRSVAIERVPVTAAVSHLIRQGDLQLMGTHIQTGRDVGMIPLERSLARLVRAGTVDATVARAVALDHDYFDRAIRSA